jgi:hypothetical protein
MNISNMYDLFHGLAENRDDLNGNFPSQLAAADVVLNITRQSPWKQADMNAKREQLHTQLDSWYKTGPFSSQKWSTTTTTIAWQPLGERAKIFYSDMESYIRSCISRIHDQDTSVNNHIVDDPEYPVGHMPIFCDLVRLIVGTVDYTPLPREYRALTAANRSVLSEPNPVKTALQYDGVWMQLLKDIVAYVRWAEDFQGVEDVQDICNLTKMAASVQRNKIELETEYHRLLAMRTDLEENAGLTIARHRHHQEDQGSATHVLMHKLLHLTQV